MSLMSRTHPLEIPEILTIVGSFIPAWQDSPRGPKFVPGALLSCSMVNRTWRDSMLPHLWAVYDQGPLRSAHVPPRLLFKYSHFFRFFQPPHRPRGIWRKDPSIQPLLDCTHLKSFYLTTSFTFNTQLQLVHKNPDIEELYWSCFSPKKLLGTIEDAVRPFAESLKSLRLEGGEYTTPELLALLDCFPNLLRLHVARPRPSMHLTLLGVREEMSASPECTRQGVGQIRSLKKLTLENGFTEDACTETLLVLGRYPVIEHLDLRIVDSSHSIWSESLLDIPFDLLKHLHSMKDQALQYSEQGLERLDFKVGWDKTTGTCCSMQFKDRGSHMVALSATLWGRDADVLLSVLSAHVECLQSLDLECHFMHNARGVLGEVLGKFHALQHFRFIAHGGLTKEESFSIFEVGLGQNHKESQQGSESPQEAASCTEGGTVWACMDLESLDLDGLWKTSTKDRLNPGQVTWTFLAASKGHQWVARDSTKFGKQFRGTISQRVQALPHLRALTLSGVTFDLCKIDELTPSIV